MARRPPAVARVLERVAATVGAHDLWLPGQTVVVAVSGGPDSVCLLEALVRLRRTLRHALVVAHVDHGGRPGSSADAAYVRRLAARHRLPFVLRRLTGDAPDPGRSREEWLRSGRRLALAEVQRETGAARIATAHTRDDNAETVLLRLLTGSGSAGAAGIRYRSGPFVHPLLDVGRDEVEACCRSLHLRPRRDPTNDDPDYALRNALRLEGLPALERALGRNVREPLARSAALLAADDAELGRQMAQAWPEVAEDEPEGIGLDADALLRLPRVVAARLVGHALLRTGGEGTRADVEAVLDLAAGRPGRRRDLTGGTRATRDRTSIRLARG
ncbi:MAG: tRNA lysidine(34) synthetase TilS [Planctomycetaceae bacterium]